MATKTNGPLIRRIILRHYQSRPHNEWATRTATNIGGSFIVIPFDSPYLEKLALGQPPAPDTEVREKPKARW